jgi:hypothetical protein
MLLTEFVPKTIEKHDNRLFAANIKEDTWDVEYDARAYRCDSNGNILLKHSNSNENIEGTLDELGRINGKDVPKDHDCINPSNEILFGEDANRYIYYMKDGVPVIGGKGPNISYEFCFTDVVCSDQKPMTALNLDGSTQTVPSVSLELESSHVHTKKINIYDIMNARVENSNYLEETKNEKIKCFDGKLNVLDGRWCVRGLVVCRKRGCSCGSRQRYSVGRLRRYQKRTWYVYP